jgi:formylmethanofuran dehydrogenase subunit D
MVAEILPTFASLVVLAVVSVMSAGKSSHVLTFDFFFMPRTDFASQLISMDSDGTMYPSTQMLHWSP